MKILVLSPIYPRIDAKKNTTATKVIHYFAVEWKKQGHDVYVIHTPNRILKFFYVMPQKIKDFLKAKTGNEFPDVSVTRKFEYEYEGIPVYRRPFFKLIPRSLPSAREVKQGALDIKKQLEKDNFVPDVIVSHWATPSFQLLDELNKYFSCKKAIVLHDSHYTDNFKNSILPCISSIDAIGCRSKTLSETVKEQLQLVKTPFVCYSGVPDAYVNSAIFDAAKYNKPITRFIYVGELITRKYCDVVISALSKAGIENWHLDVVGVGNERARFEEVTKQLGVNENVTFHGRIPREKVFGLMGEAQCFVMPSVNEAFGLVYLESMVSSCIAIGSIGEGIDGIIEDRENGFLISPGNEAELIEVLKNLKNMKEDMIREIAIKGFNTAIKFTDSRVAEMYLENVIQ